MAEVQGEGSIGYSIGRQVIHWWRNTWGRITTALGAAFLSIDVFDVTPVQQPLADLIGTDRAKRLVGGASLICLVLSYIRHQQVAGKYRALQQQLAEKS